MKLLILPEKQIALQRIFFHENCVMELESFGDFHDLSGPVPIAGSSVGFCTHGGNRHSVISKFARNARISLYSDAILITVGQ